MNAISLSTSNRAAVRLATLLACLTAGCAADVVGTGEVGRTDPSGTTSAPGDEPSGTADANAPPKSKTGTETGAGVPAEIQALFEPPEDDTVTPDSIFGLWASVGSLTEDRLKVTQNSLTLARRCTEDGAIAHVTAKIRVTEDTITVLESKSASLKGMCSSQLRLEVEEWRLCSSYDCIRIYGTKMIGLALPGIYSETSWIKLSG